MVCQRRGIVELSCCPFFKRHGADFLHFIFRMRPASASGRIWIPILEKPSVAVNPMILRYLSGTAERE